MVDQVENLILACDTILSRLRSITPSSPWLIVGVTFGGVVYQVRDWLEDLTASAALIDVGDPPPTPPTRPELSVGMTTKRGIPWPLPTS
jgi:hypothetical protein